MEKKSGQGLTSIFLVNEKHLWKRKTVQVLDHVDKVPPSSFSSPSVINF